MGTKALEVFKFTLYVGVPIGAVMVIAAPWFLDKVLQNVCFSRRGIRFLPLNIVGTECTYLSCGSETIRCVS
jgi:hypothetical protein